MGATSTPAAPATAPPRHSSVVRVTHWLTVAAFLALLATGLEIVVAHPRFYWGEAGNVQMAPWLKLPIPASRATVPTGYGYVLADQDGWSRYLHFQSAWVAVLTGLFYLVSGVWRGHFRRNLLPAASDLSPKALLAAAVLHLRRGSRAGPSSSYNAVQRITYLTVIFVLFPVMIWTGLAMSPGFVSAVPGAVTFWGGHQSARSVHFLVTLALVAFFVVHIAMVFLAGFRNRMRAMITGA